MEEDSEVRTIDFKQLLKLTIDGTISGCVVPPVIQVESLRHVCIDVQAYRVSGLVDAMSYWERNPWDTRPRFPNLRSCIIRARWGFPIEPLALFIKSHHHHLIALEFPLYFGILHSIQIPNDETTTTKRFIPPPPPPHPLKLLRLQIKQFDMLYVSDELIANIPNDIEDLCKQRAQWGFKLELLRPMNWEPRGPAMHMMQLGDRIPGFCVILYDERDTIPAEESWNRALLDGGEKEQVLNLGRRETTFDK